ncbi:MAG: KHG/KDPG aldolase [Alphaproteobacteria bacterium ADurb.Bin438]|nr:MAG: KHG/KDPG aldolase [Alphaproteobacteria bacterium ADurb.Bin438]
MARYSRIETLVAMKEAGIIPVFYNSDFETAKDIMVACVKGGARVIEFTNRGDFAHEVFAALVKYAAKELPEAILGIGSVVDPYTAAIFIQNGANFIVGPTFNEEVARCCNRRGIPYSPGCGSATEVSNAYEMGVEIVKVFPGKEVGGPGFVKSVKGPMPWVKIMPTGGVSPTKESLTEWFNAGVTCVGIGSNLITKELIKAKDYKTMEAKVKEVVDFVKTLR